MHGPPADSAMPLMNLSASRPWAAQPSGTGQRQPPHSYLPRDHHPRMPGASRALTGASTREVARTREQIARFFGGLEMVSPGLVKVSGWRPAHLGPQAGPAVLYAGIGRKSIAGRPR
jgi:hypothetical protein